MKKTQARALPWLGADTMVCEQYADLLANCKHVTVPFCGGLSVVAHLVKTAREIVCSDKHRLAINLFAAISYPESRQILLDHLSVTPFHEDVLSQCQQRCREAGEIESYDVDLAYSYFVTAWMGRGGKGGSTGEFKGDLPVRWTATGGASPLRFQTAVRSIQEVWGPICERCSFLCRDWHEVVDKIKNDASCGMYCDPPWIGAGDEYVHRFSLSDHTALFSALSGLPKTKIVVRYGDHPDIRSMYRDWNVKEIVSRNQANGATRELCITNF